MATFVQNVIVMRHGDRRDNFDPKWVQTAEKPWDPPLIDAGLSRALRTGRELRQLGFPIHRVFVSPFLRCVQTASQVVFALCATSDDVGSDDGFAVGGSVPIDPSKVKVSIEYGLCEMLNSVAIRPEFAPKDGDFRFNVPELEAILPHGTVDHAAEKIHSEMPQWGESVSETRSRYVGVIQELADKYPSENLLFVTHGEGVGVSVSTLLKGVEVYDVNYCAYSHARRRIICGESESFNAENFQLLNSMEKAGILYTSHSFSDDL